MASVVADEVGLSWAMANKAYSQRRACDLLSVNRGTMRYSRKGVDDNAELKALLIDLSKQHKRWGVGLMFQWLRGQGYGWNHKRVYRLYCELGLNLRVKPRKRFPSREPVPLCQPNTPNTFWSVDFMADALASGRKFRTFNVIDDFNRESLAIEIDYSLPTARIIRVLDQIAAMRGYPDCIRADNGPELISHALLAWAEQYNVTIAYIQPGKPAQNAFIERFNRTYREDVLDQYYFYDLDEVRTITEEWMAMYNSDRPHSALNGMSPKQFATYHLT